MTKSIEERLIELEICVTDQDQTISELNDECVRMSKQIDLLIKQQKMLMEFLKESPVKPLSEEVPPPHY